jgi:hypothetical protein
MSDGKSVKGSGISKNVMHAELRADRRAADSHREGFLDRVLGLAHAAEDPVGDREQQRPQAPRIPRPGSRQLFLGTSGASSGPQPGESDAYSAIRREAPRPPVTDCGLCGPRLVLCYQFCTAPPASGWPAAPHSWGVLCHASAASVSPGRAPDWRRCWAHAVRFPARRQLRSAVWLPGHRRV